MEKNFNEIYEIAGTYKSARGQSLSTYCFDKVKRMNPLNSEIPEEKIVKFVVYCIHDDYTRTSLITAKKKTLTELTQCLVSLTVKNLQRQKSEKREIIKIGS